MIHAIGRFRVVSFVRVVLLLCLTTCTSEEFESGEAGVETEALLAPITLEAVADTRVADWLPVTNYGTGTTLNIASVTFDDTELSMVRFDRAAIVSGVGTGTLQSATLKLTIDAVSLAWIGGQVAAHRMTRSWTENGATWLCANDTDHGIIGQFVNNCASSDRWGLEYWSLTPRPYATTPTATVVLGPGQTGVVSLDVTADVQAVLSGGAHHGWLIASESGFLSAWARFASRHTGAPPQLVLTLEEPSCLPTGAGEGACNGIDDDCDDLIDEAYVPRVTSCGAGVCAAVGVLSCDVGVDTDSCTPGSATGIDVSCDALDDDCDGVLDEAYVATPTSCGVGACASTGELRCVAGVEQNTCSVGQPAASDPTCDGLDEDCDGLTDDNYAAMTTTCGAGACASTGMTSCQAGSVVDSCVAVANCESNCSDEADDDGDGEIDCADDDCASQPICILGSPCDAAEQCESMGGVPECLDEAESGVPGGYCTRRCGTADPSNPVCPEGSECVDDQYCAVSCDQSGVCEGERFCSAKDICGRCQPTDASCDGVDQDCSGIVDDEYASSPSQCGVGSCAATGQLTCPNGVETNSCAPGSPAASDASCDGLDQDCDGLADDDFPGASTTCGVGGCGRTGVLSCVGGTVVDSCTVGTPAGSDATCNGVDDDCDARTDEAYTATQTTCTAAGCSAVGRLECVAGSPRNTCGGAPVTCVAETNCGDAADNDSDGSSDCADSDCAGNAACVNATPTLTAVPNQTIAVGTLLTLALQASDPEADPLSFSASPLPLLANATLAGGTGVFKFQPDSSQVGSHVLTFVVSDGHSSASRTVTITVSPLSPTAPTGVRGVLLDAEDAELVPSVSTPIVGATIRDIVSGTSVVTAADGSFTLTGLFPGEHTVEFDGTTAVGPIDYGSYRATKVLEANVIFEMSQPVYLPHLDTAAAGTVVAGMPTMIHNASIGADLFIPANSVVDEQGQNFTGTLTLSQVPERFTPGALPEDLEPGLVVTVQPMGLTFRQPAPITFPNTSGLTPGSEVDIWSLDHGKGAFFIAGRGQVSPDGLTIVTISGGVRESSWHFILSAATSPGPGDGAGDGSSGPGGDGAGPGGGDGSGGDSSGGDGSGSSSGSPGGGGPGGGGDDEGGAPGAPPGGGGGGGGDGPPGCEASSSWAAGDGCVGVEIHLPDYHSQGIGRGLSLLYESKRAYPFPVLVFHAEVPVRAAVPPILSYQLRAGGVTRSELTQVNTVGFSENQDEPFVGAVGFDASDIATTILPATLRVTSDYGGARVSSSTERTVVVINEKDSAIGAGWGVAELSKLVTAGKNRLLVHGNGSSRVYRPEATTVASVLNFADFSDTSTLRFNGSAASLNTPPPVVNGKQVLRLTSAVEGQASSILHMNPVPLVEASGAAQGFSTRFTFQMAGAVGLGDGDGPGADGMTFVLTNSASRLGGAGGGMGFVGVGPSVVVKFDTYDNGEFPNHVGVNLNGSVNPVAVAQVTPRFNNGAEWQAWIDYDASRTRLEIRVAPAANGRPEQPTLSATVDIRGILTANQAFVGFTAATGGGVQRHEVRDWEFSITELATVGEYISPAGDFSKLVGHPNGTFTHRSKGGVVRHFNPSGAMTSHVDRAGNTTSYAYDPEGRLAQVTDVRGLVTTLAYADGRLTRITDPTSRATEFMHDAAGNLTRVTYPDGSAREFGYDSRHLMTSETNQRGQTKYRVFDSAGRLTRAVMPDQSQREVRDREGALLVEGSSIVPALRPDADVSVYTDAEGRSSKFEVNSFGYATSLTTPAGHTTRIERNDLNQRTLIESPSGQRWSMSYDDRGNVLTRRDETLGGTTTWTYEPEFNRVTSVKDNRGKIWNYEYDAQGNWTRSVSPLGREITRTYLPDGRLSTHTDVFGTTTQRLYDAQGNVNEVRRGTGADTRLTSVTRTPSGLIDLATDPENRNFDRDYDEVNRTTRIGLPDMNEVLMSYGPAGELLSITPPDQPPHEFEYDERERLAAYAPPVTSAADTRIRTSYNTEDQVTYLTRADGQTVMMSYDNAGRLAAMSVSRGEYEASYDAATGQVTRLAAPDGSTLEFSYLDDRPRSTTWSGTVAGTVGLSYDPDGRIAGRQIGIGNAIGYAYDDDAQLSMVQSSACFLNAGCVCTGSVPPVCSGQTQAPSLQLGRDASTGALTSAALGSSITSWAYDAFGAPVAQQSTHGAMVLYAESLTRDKLGRITSKVETIAGVALVRDYAYDVRGRLQQVQENGALVSGYAYDPNGNRLSRTTPTETVTGVYDEQDRLVSYGGVSYEYSADGELVSQTQTTTGAATTYDYDELGNLLEVRLPDGRVIEYEIDALNRRVGRKVDGTVTQRWLYENQQEPIAELDASGALVSLFVYGTRSHVPDLMLRDGVTYRIIADHVGSVRLVVNAGTGTIAQRIDYDEFGNVLSDSNPGFQPFGFAGGLYDADTGLVRFGARDYDAVTGRWTAKDPILFEGGTTNLYEYVNGDPINKIDPSGKWDMGAAAEAAARAGSAAGAALGAAASVCLQFVFPSKAGDDPTPDPERERCRQVKNQAVENCSWLLNQRNKPGRTDRFNQCVNSYMSAHGC